MLLKRTGWGETNIVQSYIEKSDFFGRKIVHTLLFFVSRLFLILLYFYSFCLVVSKKK